VLLAARLADRTVAQLAGQVVAAATSIQAAAPMASWAEEPAGRMTAD
jgi:hypothetical protein